VGGGDQLVARRRIGTGRPQRADQPFGGVEPAPQDVVAAPVGAEEAAEVVDLGPGELGAPGGVVDQPPRVTGADPQDFDVVVLARQQVTQWEGGLVVGREALPQRRQLGVGGHRLEAVAPGAVQGQGGAHRSARLATEDREPGLEQGPVGRRRPSVGQ
jgi:hypothetical protein